jgi:hypothetical protein
MPRQSDGYWIDGMTGKISKVTRHELWPFESGNLEDFGLESLKPVFAELVRGIEQSEIRKHADEIRITLMRQGLVRTRNNQGTISIQFYCNKNYVPDYLFNTAVALQKVGEYGLKAWIHNIKYDDAVNIGWKDFINKSMANTPVMKFPNMKNMCKFTQSTCSKGNI